MRTIAKLIALVLLSLPLSGICQEKKPPAPISKTPSEMGYSIGRFESRPDGSLFICIGSKTTPNGIEHVFTDDEAQDVSGTIENLIAQLQVMDDNYVPPDAPVSLLDTVKDAPVNQDNVAAKKVVAAADKAAKDAAQAAKTNPKTPSGE
jgi:hypothetical protein